MENVKSWTLWCPTEENCDLDYPSHAIAILEGQKDCDKLERAVQGVGFDYMDCIEGESELICYFGGSLDNVVFIEDFAQLKPFLQTLYPSET